MLNLMKIYFDGIMHSISLRLYVCLLYTFNVACFCHGFPVFSPRIEREQKQQTKKPKKQEQQHLFRE